MKEIDVDFGLEGKVVIVTGGNGAIGAATASCLWLKGHWLLSPTSSEASSTMNGKNATLLTVISISVTWTSHHLAVASDRPSFARRPL
jgi:hypothetical protein